MKVVLLSTIIFAASCAGAATLPAGCDVSANTEYGEVCGKKLSASNGDPYAAFKGMPYARAPEKSLRFAEPQPPDRYDGIFDATEHGPVCPQYDIIYGPVTGPRVMSEDCLRVNVYTPLDSLPNPGSGSSGDAKKNTLLPVLVWIHGGAFTCGSGDSDVHGPEYLMSGKEIILVTFNYRLNVFGFLSLGSKEIPGNAGLRDCRFLLEWVQSNIAGFGGDPARVTLGGQSAGAILGHMLSISPAVKKKKLFNRLMCLSGTAIAGLYSYYPTYTNFITPLYLLAAGKNLVQSQEGIYKDLIDTPVERLMQANKLLLSFTGLVTFTPVIEKQPQSGFLTLIPKDPEILLNEGYGKEYVTWLEFTSAEAQDFKMRLEEVHLETTFRLLPSFTLPMNTLWSGNVLALPVITALQMNEYFNNTLITLDKYLPAATDQFFKYPVMRLTEKRLKTGAQATFVSQFGFYNKNNPFKVAQKRDWHGAAHAEDITYFFRLNTALGPLVEDELVQDNDVSRMKRQMTDFVAQFVKTGSPVAESEPEKWPPTGASFSFFNISLPHQQRFIPATPYMLDKKKYFDKINAIAGRM